MRLTEQNVKEVVLDASMNKTVFLYFYADAPECQKATNTVKTAISDNNDYISLVEANVSEQITLALASQIGLQSVPALAVISKGQPVDILVGDDVISKLQECINKYTPSEEEMLIKEAIADDEAGNLGAAISKAKQAYELCKKAEYKLTLAGFYIKNKDLASAHALLDNPGREEQEMQEYKDLVSALTLAEQAADSPELKELEKSFNEDPNNNEIITRYAAALADAGKKEKALEILFAALKKDLSNADVKNLSEVLGFIDNFLESVNCPPKAQMQIDTSVEEIFVNIAGYAYQDNKGTADIEIYLTDNNTVCIELTDSGKPFNPLAKADPDTSLSASERKIGGLGIFMVKKMMDKVEYLRYDNCNKLYLYKKI